VGCSRGGRPPTLPFLPFPTPTFSYLFSLPFLPIFSLRDRAVIIRLTYEFKAYGKMLELRTLISFILRKLLTQRPD
jgi:hypothetical protein